MAYYAVFDINTGEIERIVDSPEFLADRISYNINTQAIAKLPKEVKDTEYKIIGEDLVRIIK